MHESHNDQAAAERAAVVIEDDPDIRDLIIAVFQQSGFAVHGAASGLEGVEAVLRHDPVVVTLDLGLPDIDGLEVARRIRLRSDCYIVMLTARTDEAETLMGLGAGADDFITKPFRPRELRARVDAMLRRPRGPGLVSSPPQEREPVASTAPLGVGLQAAGAGIPSGVAIGRGASAAASDRTALADGPARAGDMVPAAPAEGTGPTGGIAPAGSAGGTADGGGGGGLVAADTGASEHRDRGAVRPSEPEGDGAEALEHNGLRVDPQTRSAWLAEEPLSLTRTEFDLLQTLMLSGRRVRTKTDLVRHLRADHLRSESYVSEADERAVEVHIGNVRRKLSRGGQSQAWIETVRGVGYRMAPRAGGPKHTR